MCNVWILFITRAFVIFRAVCFPISQAHPTEVMFAIVTLHVVTAAVFLDANVAFRALKKIILLNVLLTPPTHRDTRIYAMLRWPRAARPKPM